MEVVHDKSGAICACDAVSLSSAAVTVTLALGGSVIGTAVGGRVGAASVVGGVSVVGACRGGMRAARAAGSFPVDNRDLEIAELISRVRMF